MIPKLEQACSNDDLRPVMQSVCFDEQHKKDGLWATATDGHMLIRWNASDEFSRQETELLAGKMIHKRIWKDIAMVRRGYPRPDISDEGIIFFYPYPHLVKWGSRGIEETISEYPKWRGVIHQEAANAAPVGLNMKLIARLDKIFGKANSTGQIVFRVHLPNKPVYGIIEGDTTNAFILLMPVSIYDVGRDWSDKFDDYVKQHKLEVNDEP